MHDYDCEFVFDYEVSCHDYLDEGYTNHIEYDLDDDYDYARNDSTDYQQLAYNHFAWYNSRTSKLLTMIAQKKTISVTLDIECYDDLNVEELDWKMLLGLEGDEKVNIFVSEFDPYVSYGGSQ